MKTSITGYGVKTLGVCEAIEERQFDRVEHEIQLLSQTLIKVHQNEEQEK